MSKDRLITVIARAMYANYALTMVEIGIHVFMALYGLSVFLETSESLRKGRKRYIAASFTITILSCLTASLDVAHHFQIIFEATSPQHWAELMEANVKNWKPLLSDTALGIVIWIGDALLVYRCYVICVEYWWVTVIPALTSLSALVLFITSIYISSPATTSNGYLSACTFLTVSTNIMVTTSITFTLLRARRTMAEYLPARDLQLYNGVVAILIESALPLSVFGIIAGALMQASCVSTWRPTEAYVVCYELFVGLFYSFCALSPHMIIFRVTTGRSFIKFPNAKKDTLSSIHFAPHTTEYSCSHSSAKLESGIINVSSQPQEKTELSSSICAPGEEYRDETRVLEV